MPLKLDAPIAIVRELGQADTWRVANIDFAISAGNSISAAITYEAGTWMTDSADNRYWNAVKRDRVVIPAADMSALVAANASVYATIKQQAYQLLAASGVVPEGAKQD